MVIGGMVCIGNVAWAMSLTLVVMRRGGLSLCLVHGRLTSFVAFC